MKIHKKRLDIVLCVIAMIVAALTIFCADGDEGANANIGSPSIGSPSSESGCRYSFEISTPYEDEYFNVGTAISFEVTTDMPLASSFIEWSTVLTSGHETQFGDGNPLIDDTLEVGSHIIKASNDINWCQDHITINIIDPSTCLDEFDITSPSNNESFNIGDTISFEVTADPAVPSASVSWETEIGGISTSMGSGNPLNDDTLEKGNHTITATNLDKPECQDAVSIQVNDPGVSPAISIPDTGLDEYYDDDWQAIPITKPDIGDDFYGQDAHYVKDLSHTGDDTGAIPIVTDDVTQLVWQEEDSAVAYNWTKANEYCAGLVGGWRLPNQEELMTIVNYGASNPTGFDEFNTLSQYYWSSTEFASDTTQAWVINFYYGHSQGMSKETPFADVYTRCVKDSGVSFPDGHTFEVLPGKPEIITDATTGYQWHQADNGTSTLNWLAALDHCEVSQEGGFDDWKLPDVKELNTIVDRSQASAPFIDPLFSTTAVGQYESQSFWTSTTDPFMSGSFGSAWQVNFKTGRIASSYKQYGESAFVRCMRIP